MIRTVIQFAKRVVACRAFASHVAGDAVGARGPGSGAQPPDPVACA